MNETTILLIDDDALSLNSLARGLRLNGIKVDAFNSPVEALEKFNKTNYNIVLSDIMMPIVDGFEILRRIKAVNEEIKVILFTGFYTVEIGQKARFLGADKLFIKPVQIRELAELIDFLIFQVQSNCKVLDEKN
ncbi:MAG: response regulator [Candidatus Delongbacteria bacterium]|nr:response regulator [Candidatus Delongbacteria bacterium]MBN2837102.1 response regulator [Candidatus Delongbacteria bacterium]